MNKEEMIYELKLKTIELELERDKEQHRAAFGVMAAVLMFLVTTGFTKDSISIYLTNLFKFLLSISVLLFLGVFVLMVIGLPVLAYFVSTNLFSFYLKSQEKIYNKKIEKLNRMIKNYRKNN
jgi:hypothetical protein